MRESDAVIAANRFGLGARPGEIRALGGGARDALLAQLHGAPPLLAAKLPASHQLLAQTLARREAERGPGPGAAPGAPPSAAAVAGAMQSVREIYQPAYADETLARFSAAVASERSFLERLTHFWSNHFAVSVDKMAVLGLAGAMEREAIRPYVLGNFADMLLAAEKHPAMLLYLDNQLSTGPNSEAGRMADRRGRDLGLNENLGREILELHTLGVDGGYSQQDVRALASMITGWTIGGEQGRLRGGEPGKFHFASMLHEPGGQVLMRKGYGDGGLEQGERALRGLARHPATARHLATKLVRHFVADDPPPALIDRVAAAYLRANADLPSTYRALLDAEETWAEPLTKYRTPSDYIHAAWRALQLPVAPRDVRVFEQLGQRSFQPGSPAGWPDRSADWDGAAALMKRIVWAQETSARLGPRRNARQLAAESLGTAWSAYSEQAVRRAQDATQALTLVLASPEFMRR